MEILGYIASLFIGIALGLLGGGGSILTVPVLYYLFGIPAVLASAYSLFIVGISALVGVIPRFRKGLVNVKTAILFGIPSLISVFLTRKYLIPLLPEQFFQWGTFQFKKETFLMSVFALLMLGASYSMIRSKKESEEMEGKQAFNFPILFLEGIAVGILAGMVGAGGGFLIIPALVIWTKLPMKLAIGTSLLIIATNSLIGFTGDLGHTTMDWPLILSISFLAIVGIFIGNKLGEKIDGSKLKKGFGWFVLAMGLFILIKELFFPPIH
jgi:uncharacterized membrane protein YfcA